MKKVSLFLGGTCASSTWREELLEMLDSDLIDAFNPVVPDWTPECQAIEDEHRVNDDLCLYVITPEGVGFYSYVEVVDDSNKRPERTVMCVLEEANGATYDKHNLKCALKTMNLVAANGVFVTDNLETLAAYLNAKAKEIIATLGQTV